MGCSNGVGCVYGGFGNIFMFFFIDWDVDDGYKINKVGLI